MKGGPPGSRSAYRHTPYPQIAPDNAWAGVGGETEGRAPLVDATKQGDL